MAHNSMLTDDAVAARLIQDASDHALRFSALGVSKPEHKPKPNTRFLRNIIKTTESHNAALLAKEAAESQARLQDLNEAEEKDRRRHRPSTQDIRRRQLGDISAILHGRSNGPSSSSRRRHHDSEKSERRRRSKDRSERERHKREKRDRSCESDGRQRKSRSSRDRDLRSDSDRDEEKDAHESRISRHLGKSSRRREDRGSRDRRERSHHHHRDRHRSASPDRRERSSKHRERSRLRRRGERDRDDGDDTKDLIRSPRSRKSHGDGRLDSRRVRSEGDDEDTGGNTSDPLEDLIGPLPPPAPRGRGGTVRSSGIDARFSESYDPKLDVEPPEAKPREGDWENAVEAFRDRQKWKAQGAARLREAGFTEEQVRKWEASGGREGGEDVNIEDMRWSKKGELRQWDRGKTVNDDGSVATGPEWAK